MISEIIVPLLKANADLMALVSSDNIFPLIAAVGTVPPVIIYQTNDLTTSYNKDGKSLDLVPFHCITIAEDYEQMIAICKEVRKSLELKSASGTRRIIVTKYSEGFNLTEQVYMGKFDFAIEIFN